MTHRQVLDLAHNLLALLRETLEEELNLLVLGRVARRARELGRQVHGRKVVV